MTPTIDFNSPDHDNLFFLSAITMIVLYTLPITTSTLSTDLVIAPLSYLDLGSDL